VFAAAIVIPLGLDGYLPVPADNPVTAAKIDQGRQLFFDRRLSRDGSVSCASCHDPTRAFSDGRAVAVGVFGRRGRRNAPALINRGYGRLFFWDGRARSLEQQVLMPIADPNEMDLPVDDAARRVGVDPDELARALATYVRTRLFGDSPYDRLAEGDVHALSEEAQHGLAIFRGKGNCTACHVGPNFSDEKLHNTGIAWNGVSLSDIGGGRGDFKTPTLREVARTAPYMHDGSLATLDEVVDFYDRGGRSNPNLDPEIHPLKLTSEDKAALVSFLRALTGTAAPGPN
jgi:cytochrome c peroxidase